MICLSDCIYNANMFGGRQVIKPEELSEINAESDIIEKCRKIIFKGNKTENAQTKRALWRYRDIVMKWHGIILMILACEIQDKVHHAMPIRGMLYDALSYTDQMREIWEHLNEEERKTVDGAEFFSRFRKEDKLRSVVTLVFYYGEQPWDGSLELYDMFEFESEEDLEVVRNFVTNYKVKLVDASRIEDLSVYHSDLKVVLGLVRCRGDKERLLTYANENRGFFESVDYETVNALGAMIQGGEKYAEMFKNNKAEEGTDMCKALEDLWEDGVKSGIRKAVFMLRKVGTADDEIVDMIKTEYNMTFEEAKKYMYEAETK